MTVNPSSSVAIINATEKFFMVKGAAYQATAGLESGSVTNAQLQFLNAAGDWEDYEVSDGTLPFDGQIIIPQSGYIRWLITGTNPVVAVDFVQLVAENVQINTGSGSGNGSGSTQIDITDSPYRAVGD